MLKITFNLYLTLIFQVTLCPFGGGRVGEPKDCEE